uniref:VPS9 domain-containing protein n=3 Tax=Lygus hesperus TaxID=30085 RepID=A0A0A9YUX6_LYGHE
MIDQRLKKEIVKNLHAAIDSEMLDQNDAAYSFYVESLTLVTDALKQDLGTASLTVKDKWNLIEFAKQSVSRVSILLNNGEPPPDGSRDGQHPSAPPESVSDNYSLRDQLFPTEGASKEEEDMLMCRYQRRLSIATSALEKQNLELELARKLVENAAITRNRMMQSSAWAMQSAHKKFKMEEKLKSGCLKESDFQKQQLFALSLQFNHGNGWLTQLGHDLALYPSNEKIARELLDNVLTDNAHPVKATLNVMQQKIAHLLTISITKSESNGVHNAGKMDPIAKVIKEDLSVIQEVLKALFEPLSTEKNSSITSEVVHHVYFSQLKPDIISLLRIDTAEVEAKLESRMKDESVQFCQLPEHAEREAKTKLHYLTTLHNPYGMLDCTVHIVKMLATSKFDHDHYTSMGADDLLPRLCQVLISSSLPEICAEAAFMEMFMPSERALGEEGYALTMLQSSIAHLTSDSEV